MECQRILIELILFCGVFIATQAQTTVNSIRLSGNGATNRKGRVEILMNGQWGTICNNAFDTPDRDVLCGMLGFNKNPSLDLTVDINTFGQATLNTPIHISELACVGTETNVDQCQYSSNFACDHSKDVAIECQGTVIPPTTTTSTTTPTPPPTVCTNPQQGVRLVDGPNSAVGRVEVLRNGQWGTICDDFWGKEDATVICRMLCYPQSDARAIIGTQYGNATGKPIWLDDVGCLGTETSISDCSNPGWGVNNCNHQEDAAVSCIIDRPPLPKVPTPTVRCENDMIGVYFLRQEEPRLQTAHLTVGNSNNQNCGFVRGVTSTEIFIRIPIANCGTQRRNNATSIIYENLVKHTVPPADPIIRRTTTYDIPVICVIDRHSNKDKDLEPEGQTVPPKINGGEFNMQMIVSDNSAFRNPVSSFPAQFKLGQMVYVGVTLYSTDKTLKIVVPNCVATAQVSRNSTPAYDLVKDKCRLDQTVTYYPYNETFFAFRFQTFAFSDTDPNKYKSVYLHCDGIVCEMNEKTQQCDRSCTSRRKRSISLYDKEIYHFDEGPFVFTRTGKERILPSNPTRKVTNEKALEVKDAASMLMLSTLMMMTSLIFAILQIH